MAIKRSKIFIIDTNVILHDHQCIFNFEENDVVLPITVLEELDKFNKILFSIIKRTGFIKKENIYGVPEGISEDSFESCYLHPMELVFKIVKCVAVTTCIAPKSLITACCVTM